MVTIILSPNSPNLLPPLIYAYRYYFIKSILLTIVHVYLYPPMVLKTLSIILIRLDGEEQQNLTNMSLCVDPDYDLLWGCGTSEIFCFNPLAAELKGEERSYM